MHSTELLLDVWGRWARLDGLGLGYKSPMAVMMGLRGDASDVGAFDDGYMEMVGQAVAKLRPRYELYEIINARFRQRMSFRQLSVYLKISFRQVRALLAEAVRAVDGFLMAFDEAA